MTMRAAQLDTVTEQFGPWALDIRALLNHQHVRATPGRIAVLAALGYTAVPPADGSALLPEHHTAQQLYETTCALDVRIDETTVYRNIARLETLNLIHHIDIEQQPRQFGLNSPVHHHAICTGCGSLSSLAAPPIDAVLAVADINDIEPLTSGAVSVYGRCWRCRNDGEMRLASSQTHMGG